MCRDHSGDPLRYSCNLQNLILSIGGICGVISIAVLMLFTLTFNKSIVPLKQLFNEKKQCVVFEHVIAATIERITLRSFPVFCPQSIIAILNERDCSIRFEYDR